MRLAVLPLVLLALPLRAEPTALVPLAGEGGEPLVAAYSQALFVRARLEDGAGEPVVARRIAVYVARDADPESEFLLADPITDADGVATARLTLVDGRYGGQTFPAADPNPAAGILGEAYTLRFTFAGDPEAERCDADAGPPPDAGLADAGPPALCPAEASAPLYVVKERTRLVLERGNEVALGEAIDLIATLTDPNGDAPEGGTATDGTEAKPLEGRRIGFFYDADGNGRPALNELLGYADTDEQGIAVFEFVADPSFVEANNVEDGIHAQFGGDDRYALSGASENLVVTPGPPDASRTLLEAVPEELLADGFSLVELRATLVDAYGNLLGSEDELYDVEFTTDLGTLEGSAERDPLTGRYLGRLKAPRQGGTATVQVLVEGRPGSTVSVRFLDRGCGCASGSDAAPLSLLALGVFGAHRRRRSRHG